MHPSLNHSSLVSKSQELKEIQEKIIPLRKKNNIYKDLPPVRFHFEINTFLLSYTHLWSLFSFYFFRMYIWLQFN